jgi:Cu/Ag efflux protein CusF
MISKRFAVILLAGLIVAGAAKAQYGGGMGGGMGGGGGGHRGGGRHRQNQDQPPPASGAQPAPPPRQSALGKVQIDGTITAIDTANGRVTIAYGEVDALNWPAGTTPFQVEKPSLLTGLSVGEKVRFHIESQQIATIEPIGPSGSPGTR